LLRVLRELCSRRHTVLTPRFISAGCGNALTAAPPRTTKKAPDPPIRSLRESGEESPREVIDADYSHARSFSASCDRRKGARFLGKAVNFRDVVHSVCDRSR